MGIATSDGRYFEDSFAYELSRTGYRPDLPQLHPESVPPLTPSPSGMQPDVPESHEWGTPYELRNPKNIPMNPAGKGVENRIHIPNPLNEPKHIDRDHDVPLAAAALSHPDINDGKMYGIAVDRRAPKTHKIGNTEYDPSEFVYEHEQVEHAHMRKLIEAGMPELESYHEAHDQIATPTERASVKAFAVRNGEDPDKFWDEHQQFWRDVTSNAQAQDPEKVHQHTYLAPYEPEMRKKMEVAQAQTEDTRGFLQRISDYWFGSSKKEPELAPSLDHYPTEEEAAEAKKYGLGYGSGHESAINQQTANVLGEMLKGPIHKDKSGQVTKPVANFVPMNLSGYLDDMLRMAEKSSTNVDLTDPKNKEVKDKLEDTYGRAALAISRNPLAAFGFDPRHTTTDVTWPKGQMPAVGGAFSPQEDFIYTNMWRASTMVHESIHRGIEMLRKTGREDVKKALSILPPEELIVRYLMVKEAGDPEFIQKEAKLTLEQRSNAINAFEHSDENRRALKVLETAAQEEIAKRHPGGPN